MRVLSELLTTARAELKDSSSDGAGVDALSVWLEHNQATLNTYYFDVALENVGPVAVEQETAEEKPAVQVVIDLLKSRKTIAKSDKDWLTEFLMLWDGCVTWATNSALAGKHAAR